MEKYKESDKQSYCLGISLIIEALKHRPEQVKEIILSSKANKNQQLGYLLLLGKQHNISITYDDKTISKLSLKENCYGIAIFNKFTSNLETDKHILLYGFNDFGDLGTILRSAVSFNFKDIVLIDSNIDYFDPRCIRSSMGAIFHCNIVTYDSLSAYKNDYPEYNIYPLVSQSNKELNECIFNKPYSILISQDYHGVDQNMEEGFYIKHSSYDEISLSIRSAIVLEYAYNQNRKR